MLCLTMRVNGPKMNPWLLESIQVNGKLVEAAGIEPASLTE